MSLSNSNDADNTLDVNCSISVFKMAVEFLHELDVPFFKVGSGDTNNFPYLKKTAQKGPIFPFILAHIIGWSRAINNEVSILISLVHEKLHCVYKNCRIDYM